MFMKDFDNAVVKRLPPPGQPDQYVQMRVSYEDLCEHIGQLSQLEKNWLGPQVEPLGESDRMDMFRDFQRMGTLLKSSYEAADAYLTDLVCGAFLIPHSRARLSSYVQENGRLSRLSHDEIVRAYCASIYRNKLVVHKDKPRIPGSGVSADGRFRLHAFGRSPWTNEVLTTLGRLKQAYPALTHGIPDGTNLPGVVGRLFYGIPVFATDGRFNRKDRLDANNLAEYFGAESMSAAELMMAVDKFSLGVVERFNDLVQA